MSLRLTVAGVLAIPPLVVSLFSSLVVGVLSVPYVALLVFRKKSAKHTASKRQHAVVTGGSSGIGLAIAQECVKRGMERVTLLARNVEKLEACRSDLEKSSSSNTTIEVVSVDVTDASAVKEAAAKICTDADKTATFLYCCTGSAHPGLFKDLEPQVFEKQMLLNYLGTVYTVKAFLPHLTHGTICMTSSGAGQVGIAGYTAYSPTKFALRGFSEALHMELVQTKPELHVQVVYPPDTETAGYHEENKLKPAVTKKISEKAGLMQPEAVGRKVVKNSVDTTQPALAVYFQLEGWMLATLTAGMSPESSLISSVAQVSLMGLLRLVSFFYLNDFWSIMRNDVTSTISTNNGAMDKANADAAKVETNSKVKH